MNEPNSKLRAKPQDRQDKESRIVALQQSFSGPLPPPSVLEGYEHVLPGSADRILKLAEEQAEHRQKMENKAVNSATRDSTLGLLFGFIIAVIAFVLSGFMIMKGHVVLGGFIGSGVILGIVSIFVYGSKSRRPDSN